MNADISELDSVALYAVQVCYPRCSFFMAETWLRSGITNGIGIDNGLWCASRANCPPEVNYAIIFGIVSAVARQNKQTLRRYGH